MFVSSPCKRFLTVAVLKERSCSPRFGTVTVRERFSDKGPPQKLKRNPNWAANGIPTVVPGPKKSPSPPAGTRNWFKLVIGFVWLQSGFRQNAVAFERSLTGTGNAARSVTKFAPGLLRLNKLKNSTNAVTFHRSWNVNGRLTRK